MPAPQLRRVRWAVRATLALGVAASVVANVLHAQDNPISQAIAAWPPLALLLTVELISRVPVHRASLAVARLGATAAIAGIAAWVSYWHMAGVAARYGETGASPYLLPLSVDGLIIVASICLVELGGRIADTTPVTAAPVHRDNPVRTGSPVRVGAADPARAGVLVATPPDAAAQPAGAPATVPDDRPEPVHAPAAATSAAPPDTATDSTGAGSTGTAAGRKRAVSSGDRQPRPARRSGSTAARGTQPAPGGGSRTGQRPGAAPRPRRPVAETAALAARMAADRPDATDAELADALGITTARLRAVRREARTMQLDLAA